MTALTILTSTVLIILIFVQMHNSMRIEERRQELEELMDKSNHVISKFDSVFGEMTQENEKYTSLIARVHELDNENEKLFNENQELETSNSSLKKQNETLLKANYQLHKEFEKSANDVRQNKKNFDELTFNLKSLKKAKESLEIALQIIPAKEEKRLSDSISTLDLSRSILNHLMNNEIYCIGDLVKKEDWELRRMDKITRKTIDTIQNELEIERLHLGMEVTCIDGHWYHLNNETIEE